MSPYLLAMTFGEAMTKPFWEDPERFVSPMGVGLIMTLVAAYQLIRKISSGSKTLGELISTIRAEWPTIVLIAKELLAFLKVNQQATVEAAKTTPQIVVPDGTVVESPGITTVAPATPDPLTFISEQFASAKAANDTAAMAMWKKSYLDLKKLREEAPNPLVEAEE